MLEAFCLFDLWFSLILVIIFFALFLSDVKYSSKICSIFLCNLCTTAMYWHWDVGIYGKWSCVVFCLIQMCMLFHLNSFYLLKWAKLSLASLNCQVWVWVCRGHSWVMVGNELTAQAYITAPKQQFLSYLQCLRDVIFIIIIFGLISFWHTLFYSISEK
jgi:hypothetical protein